jgi:hypothetical protein
VARMLRFFDSDMPAHITRQRRGPYAIAAGVASETTFFDRHVLLRR